MTSVPLPLITQGMMCTFSLVISAVRIAYWCMPWTDCLLMSAVISALSLHFLQKMPEVNTSIISREWLVTPVTQELLVACQLTVHSAFTELKLNIRVSVETRRLLPTVGGKPSLCPPLANPDLAQSTFFLVCYNFLVQHMQCPKYAKNMTVIRIWSSGVVLHT